MFRTVQTTALENDKIIFLMYPNLVLNNNYHPYHPYNFFSRLVIHVKFALTIHSYCVHVYTMSTHIQIQIPQSILKVCYYVHLLSALYHLHWAHEEENNLMQASICNAHLHCISLADVSCHCDEIVCSILLSNGYEIQFVTFNICTCW